MDKYILITCKVPLPDGNPLYRHVKTEPIPHGMIEKTEIAGWPVYDHDGNLKSVYENLPLYGQVTEI